MHVGIVSKLWKRPALTRAFLRYWAAFKVEGVRFTCVAAISPNKDDTVRQYEEEGFEGWHFVRAPNQPLANKGNKACLAMKEFQPDIVINVGSDDFVSPEYVQSVIRAVEAGAHYIVPREVFFYDAPTGRACRAFKNHSLKAGAAFSKDLLDRFHWQPWWKSGQYPDRDLDKRIGVRNRTILPYGSGAVVDVKGEPPFFASYDHFRDGSKHREDADAAWLMAQFPNLLTLLEDAGFTGVPIGS